MTSQAESRYHRDMEPQAVHMSEAELVGHIRSILQRIQTGTEVIISLTM